MKAKILIDIMKVMANNLKRQYDQKVQNCCHDDKKSKKSCCE